MHDRDRSQCAGYLIYRRRSAAWLARPHRAGRRAGRREGHRAGRAAKVLSTQPDSRLTFVRNGAKNRFRRRLTSCLECNLMVIS